MTMSQKLQSLDSAIVSGNEIIKLLFENIIKGSPYFQILITHIHPYRCVTIFHKFSQ